MCVKLHFGDRGESLRFRFRTSDESHTHWMGYRRMVGWEEKFGVSGT